MTISRVKLENFTVFESLDLEPSPGINVLVGANGTGKTHLMKVCYAACGLSQDNEPFDGKLLDVFLPSSHDKVRLLKQDSSSSVGRVIVNRGETEIATEIYRNYQENVWNAPKDWTNSKIDTTYIPAKDMLANAPGFRSLYAYREVHFDETYMDILDKAFLPALRNPSEYVPAAVSERLEAELGGKVTIQREEFFLSSEQGEIEFTLLAEGLRKLGLLWLLIRNGSLRPGAVLFWDEPETNLNPKLYGVVIEVLLELQRLGVQIFLATHDYVILKELDLQAKEGDKVAFHSLYRSEETGEIACQSTNSFLQIHPNVISEVFDSIYDRDVRRALEGVVK